MKVLLLIVAQIVMVCLSIDKGLVVIPGLGRTDRLKTVVRNIGMLQANYFSKSWDCVIYVYAPRTNIEFWKNKELEYLTEVCNIIENPEKRVTDNLYMVQPPLINSYDYIFILLDDCKLISSGNTGYFELQKMIDVMNYNNLTVASPMVVGANVGGGQKFRNIMQSESVPGTEGYVSVFVELFAWLMKPQAYKALWELLYPAVNPYGWGYDFWYNNYAKSRVIGHKMGIVSTVKVKHVQDFSQPNDGRTDTAGVPEKWQALVNQEKYYLSYFKVDLKRYREKLELKNSSWNGAVTGYLMTPPTPLRKLEILDNSTLSEGNSSFVGEFDSNDEYKESEELITSHQTEKAVKITNSLWKLLWSKMFS